MPLNRTPRRVRTGVIRYLPTSGFYAATVDKSDGFGGIWRFRDGAAVPVSSR